MLFRAVPIGSNNLSHRPITGRRAERRRPTWWTCVWRPPPPSSPTISSLPPSNLLIPPPLRPSWAAAAPSWDAAAQFWVRAAASSPTEVERIAASSLTEAEGTVRRPASITHSTCSPTLGRVTFPVDLDWNLAITRSGPPKISVDGPWHFGPEPDPDPRIRTSDSSIWIRILLFSSVTFKMATKSHLTSFIVDFIMFLKQHFHHFSKIKVIKKSQNRKNEGFFLLFLLDDRKIRNRIPNTAKNYFRRPHWDGRVPTS